MRVISFFVLVLAVVSGQAATSARAGEGMAATNVVNVEATAQLFEAVVKGDTAAIRAAITNRANVNARNSQGLTPLLLVFHSAKAPLNEAQHQAVAILLQNQAGNGATDAEGRTALICATRLGDLDSVRQLVQADSLVKARDFFHKTALIYAVDMKRRDIVEYLAANGDLQSLTYREKNAGKK